MRASVRVSVTTIISFGLAISACANVIGVQDYTFVGSDGGTGGGGTSSGSGSSGSAVAASGSAGGATGSVAGSTSGAVTGSSGATTGATGSGTTGATGSTSGATTGSTTGTATTGSATGTAGTSGTTTGKSGSTTGSTTGSATTGSATTGSATTGSTTGTATGTSGTSSGTTTATNQTCSSSNPVSQSFNAGLTFYQQTAANNCAVPWPSDGMYVALSTSLYDNPSGSSACGKCVQVTGASGSAKTLFVVDQCPVGSNAAQCSVDHLDLSPTAYTAVQGSQNPGVVNNSPGLAVKFVPCPVTGPFVYSFTSSSQQFYLAMVIENARYGIQTVKYRPSGSGSFTDITPRTDADAHWIINGNPPNPIDFQVVDEWGQVVEDDNVHWAASQNINSSGQFNACP